MSPAGRSRIRSVSAGFGVSALALSVVHCGGEGEVSDTGGAAGMAGVSTGAGGSSGGSPAGGTAGSNATGGGGATGGTNTAGQGASGGSSGASGAAGSAGTAPSAGGASAGATMMGGSAGSSGSAGAMTAGTSSEAGTAGAAGSAGGSWTPEFETRELSPDHYSEGADVGDIDGDGTLDLVAGPIWYKGPDFAEGGRVLDPVPTFSQDQYSTFFLSFVGDVDGDTLPDVIGIGDAGGGNGSGNPNAFWYKNPGMSGLGESWQKTALFEGLVSNESPIYANLVGDAKKELVFMTERVLGYAEPAANPTAPWTFHAISGEEFGTPYVHGLGVGDVNGDGRADVVERTGIWLQPESGSTWERHEVDFGAGLTGSRPSNWGGSQMIVYDVDGDGDSDVVTALAAHRYGFSWFEQIDLDTFTPHEIMPPSDMGDSVSQLHAVSVGDLNGDGLLDVITGKRYYAHPSSNPDPGTTDPAAIIWFELTRGAEVSFTPRQIHADSGVGCNFIVHDVTGDGRLDVFVSNKHGTFLHTQR
jgi:hypothetical protein